jgi:hypothetical protein
MWFGILTLATALIISVSAAYYSILGLTAIFAAAFWPIVILGSSLEVGKVVSTLWLHKYWHRAEIQYKIYLCTAVLILMVLTSMGVFGFLSKAHSDQGLVSGDVTAKIAIYDEKIRQARDNIAVARSALTQMDAAVDQTMSRSTDEKGADKAAQLRRSQGPERNRLLREIEAEQKKIQALNDERAPIAAEVRKVEAEVGPIKYIAALIYGDNADANMLERAVRWVIILIVIVFDPLALTLLLAATKTLEWERGVNILGVAKREEPPESSTELNTANDTPQAPEFFDRARTVAQQIDAGTYSPRSILDSLDSMWSRARKVMIKDTEAEHAPVEAVTPSLRDRVQDTWQNISTRFSIIPDTPEKIAERAWKAENPDSTLKKQRQLLREGRISQLPWEQPEFLARVTGIEITTGFGKTFPGNPSKGDLWIKTDALPTTLHRFNGQTWMTLDKDSTDTYTQNTAYIDYLIEKISSGEYDPELLSESERISIEQRLNQTA